MAPTSKLLGQVVHLRAMMVITRWRFAGLSSARLTAHVMAGHVLLQVDEDDRVRAPVGGRPATEDPRIGVVVLRQAQLGVAGVDLVCLVMSPVEAGTATTGRP